MEKYMLDESKIRIDDLQLNGFRLAQEPGKFCFGTDSVMLAEYAYRQAKKNIKIMELCCGNGAVSMLMLAREVSFDITGVEIQRDVSELAAYNARLNGVCEKFRVINRDLTGLEKEYNGLFDMVVANPPYMAKGTGITSPKENSMLSREESSADFETMTKVAAGLLKDKGKFIFIQKPNRTAELIRILGQNKLELKNLQTVQSKPNQRAKLALFSAVKNGGVWCDIEPPIVIYNEDGSYTDELLKIYHVEKKQKQD